MAWKKDEVEFLLQLVRERPKLYNVKDVNYKNKVLRTKDMEKVAQEMGAIRPNTTAEECRRKWHALRTNYMAEKRKVHASKASGAGADTVRTPSLYYHEAMTFLEETMTIRPHPLEVTEESSVPAEKGEWEVFFGEDGSVLEVQDTADTPSPAPSDSSRSIARPSSSAARGKKRKPESPMPELTVELLQAAATALGTLVDQGACEESEEDAYGKLVAQRLKGISDRREKSRVMFEIEKVFFNSSMNRE